MAETFDYVIIGGGSAGSVVAGRLAATGASVLVLEAGRTDRRPDVILPAGLPVAYGTANWRYRPEPDPSRGGAVEAWPAGRILGGGGSINATVFVRGNAADFDEWERLGATGWGAAATLPYFKRLETWAGDPSPYRGTHGPIHVEPHGMHHPANDAFQEAAISAGHPDNPDYNGASQDGVGPVQVNQRRGIRSQSSRAYLRGDLGPAPAVRTGAVTTRILIEQGRATGVEYVHRRQRRRVTARSEVVLCAGVIASPKLLLLSGIGPADEISPHGIDPIVDLPGVGRNLQEHPALMQRWRATVPTIADIGVADAAKAVVEYVRTGKGPLAATVFHVQVMHRTRSDLDRPDVQLAFANFAVDKELGRGGAMKVRPSKTSGFLVSALYLHPEGRGTLRLRSGTAEDPPVIAHRLLQARADLDGLLDGMNEARRIMSEPPMKEVTDGLLQPEASCHDRDDWERLARAKSTYGAHPVGTCRMGTDEDAVVDPQLRVRGIDGLRVADASIMPTLTSGNTNAPTMMIGERAADLIRGVDRHEGDRPDR